MPGSIASQARLVKRKSRQPKRGKEGERERNGREVRRKERRREEKWRGREGSREAERE